MEDKNYCRCCKKKKLFSYLDLGRQPLANSYHKGEKLQEFPLEVQLCQNCFHSQLSVVVRPDSMFKNYLYVSGTTETFKQHCKNLANDAVSRFKQKKLKVLDIACNDGTQLEHFRALGCEVFGVDPAKNLRKITRSKKISVLVDYWTEKAAKKIGKVDIITGTNVFAHVDNLDEFLTACKISLSDDGILVLEFPYGEKMIENNEFDTVYHEHLSYFLVNSFKTLIERASMHIVDVVQTPIHGGSIRFIVQNGNGHHSKKVATYISNERGKGLLRVKTYVSFSKRVEKNKKEMLYLVAKIKKTHGKVIGYGASAKGNTMLNFFKLSLDYIVDDNSLKWGFRTPGRNIPIKSPQTINSELPGLNILILSWNFYFEIAKKILSIRGKKGQDNAIFYVPTVRINKVK